LVCLVLLKHPAGGQVGCTSHQMTSREGIWPTSVWQMWNAVGLLH
jgi:hypothetical protein